MRGNIKKQIGKEEYMDKKLVGKQKKRKFLQGS